MTILEKLLLKSKFLARNYIKYGGKRLRWLVLFELNVKFWADVGFSSDIPLTVSAISEVEFRDRKCFVDGVQAASVACAFAVTLLRARAGLRWQGWRVATGAPVWRPSRGVCGWL